MVADLPPKLTGQVKDRVVCQLVRENRRLITQFEKARLKDGRTASAEAIAMHMTSREIFSFLMKSSTAVIVLCMQLGSGSVMESGPESTQTKQWSEKALDAEAEQQEQERRASDAS